MFRIKQVTCNTTKNTIGIVEPIFSWQIESDKYGVMQSWFQIQVAIDDNFKHIIWNHYAYSNNSTNFKYVGPELLSSQRYFVRVRVKNESDDITDWSSPVYFETPLLSSDEWLADWITPVEQIEVSQEGYRHPFIAMRQFNLQSKISQARLYISTLGVYDARINEQKISRDYFRPGFTDYNRGVQFQSYDVTKQLEIKNEIDILVGEGWYSGHVAWDYDRDVYGGQNALIAQLMVWYEDGTSEVISTDSTWKMRYSNVQYSDMYDGEYFDETKQDTVWHQMKTLPFTKKTLFPQEGPSVQEIETLRPKRVFYDNQGNLLLDMGVNMVGWIRFKRPKGACKLVLSHGEILDKNGNFYNDNLRRAQAKDTYVLENNVEAKRVLQPHFTYHGFRFVKLEGFGKNIDLDDFEGVVLSSATEATGQFKTNNPLLNQLQSNIQRSQLGNFFDIPTDCPQRDERMGWTADLQIFQETASFNRNIDRFLWKWLKDLQFGQKIQNGAVPVIIPDIVPGLFSYGLTETTAAWGDAACIVPWMLYQKYGDNEILKTQYISMKSWVDYIRSQGDTEELWDTGLQLADWVALDAKEGSYYGATDGFLCSTAYYAYSTRILAETAKILRNMSDYTEYSTLYKRIVKAFQEHFLPDGVHPITNTQTANIIVLYFDLANPENRFTIADNLVELLKKNDLHMNTGFIGTPYLCSVLSKYGHLDIAYELLFADDFPSWLYQVKKGATTTWEHWDGEKPDGTFWSKDMNSFNHYAYGSIGEWMYQNIGGVINKAPGYKKIILAPKLDLKRRVTSAHCSLDTAYGQTVCDWILKGKEISIKVTIPCNTTGYVILPAVSNRKAVKEQVEAASEKKAIFSDGQTRLRMVTFMGSPKFAATTKYGTEKRAQILSTDLGFELGSGDYEFKYEVTLETDSNDSIYEGK